MLLAQKCATNLIPVDVGDTARAGCTEALGEVCIIGQRVERRCNGRWLCVDDQAVVPVTYKLEGAASVMRGHDWPTGRECLYRGKAVVFVDWSVVDASRVRVELK